MHPIDSADYAGAEVEARIHELEQDMPGLYLRHTTVFALASAWAERYDAIMALVSPDMRTAVEARLARIGIRWGVMPGSRITIEFQVSDVTALARARRPPRT